MNVTNLGLSWNSRYLELEPAELAVAILAALLVGGAVLYFLLKVLRSRPVKLLGMLIVIGAGADQPARVLLHHPGVQARAGGADVCRHHHAHGGQGERQIDGRGQKDDPRRTERGLRRAVRHVEPRRTRRPSHCR